MPDHIHLVLSIPPTFSVALVVGSPGKGNQRSGFIGNCSGVKKGFTETLLSGKIIK